VADEAWCERRVKFALRLSPLDFDSAIRGYLRIPLALRFQGSRRNAEQGVVEDAHLVEGGAPTLLASQTRGRGGSQGAIPRLNDRRVAQREKNSPPERRHERWNVRK
jgi:hypothetical protein